MDGQWLERGISFYKKEDVEAIYNDSLRLKYLIMVKLTLSVPLVIAIIIITCLLTNELITPKVGDLGVFDPDGETMQLTPVINPQPTNENAYNFALDAAIEIRTFFFSNYYENIIALEPLFTTSAFNDYLLELEGSGLLTRVKLESLNVTAAESGKNTINASFQIEDGKPYFYVRVKILLRIENLSGKDEFSFEDLFFKLAVVDRGQSKYGLLISSLEPF